MIIVIFENLGLKITTAYKSFSASGSLCNFDRLKITIYFLIELVGQVNGRIHWRLIWSQLLCATWFGLNIAGNANIPLLTGSEWGTRIFRYLENQYLKYTKNLKFLKHSMKKRKYQKYQKYSDIAANIAPLAEAREYLTEFREILLHRSQLLTV